MTVRINSYKNNQFTAMVITKNVKAYGYGFTAKEAYKNANHNARRYARVTK
jgi:dsRNA-specific ribonuclease